MEKYVINGLAEVKAVVIRYDLWMSRKTEEIFSLTAHYCIGQERKNTHIGMLSTPATDSVSLYLSVMEVVDNFGWEANIVGLHDALPISVVCHMAAYVQGNPW